MPFDTSHPLFDGSPTPVFLLSDQGTVLELNRAARRTLAVEPHRILARPILAHIVPEDRGHARECFLRALEGRESEWTTRFLRGDGAIRVQRVRSVLHHDGDEKLILLFARDLTESREGRPETRQLQTLLENLPGQFVVTLDARQRIRYSSGLARLQYRDDLEAVGAPFDELIDPDHWSRPRLSSMTDAVEKGTHWTDTIWLKRRDGTSYPTQLYVSPYIEPTHGRVLGAIVVGQDVSKEHTWRDRARAAEHFASLGQMSAEATRVFEDALAKIDECSTNPIALRRELSRLNALVSSLREIADSAHIQVAPTRLSHLIREALSRVAGTERASGVRVSVEAETDLRPVLADPRKIQRVLEILLDNAIESVLEQGSGAVRVRASCEADVVTVSITGPGPAASDEEFQRPLEPFLTAELDRGGLLLALARCIVQAHGGKIWAEREVGASATISFSLLTVDRRHTFRPKPLRIGLKRSILVVDDEDTVRTSLRRFLEKVGYEVSEAWSGRSAIAQITAGRPPEVILTDLRMTDGSGSWLLDQLAADFPDLLRHTVVLTGDPDQPSIARAIQETGCPVLTKPIDFPDLLEVLDDVSSRG